MDHDYESLAGRTRYEPERVKGSRFVATLVPVESETGAEAVVAAVRAEFPHASHHCYAFRLGPDGAVFRSNDDGEPGGSAGRPILQQLEGHAISDAMAVVTRWFGGTKLGVGGLMRAYGGAAGQALDRAPRRAVVVTERVQMRFPYGCSGAVEGYLAASGMLPVGADYGAEVTLAFDVPVSALGDFLRAFRDATGGRAERLP